MKKSRSRLITTLALDSSTHHATPAAGANTATFAAGQCTTSVTVNPTTDSTVEPDETVIFTIAAGAGYTIAAAPADAATGTIQNDDSGVSVAVAPASVNEDSGTNLVYTFTRTGVTNTPLTVTYTVTGTATNGTDYTAIGVFGSVRCWSDDGNGQRNPNRRHRCRKRRNSGHHRHGRNWLLSSRCSGIGYHHQRRC
ncbi:MAG: hypothetical protein IPG22_17400 [Acidobacteria bacterium]|nr:hypothetical protein [Acidobacteriota bacterium]